MGRPPLRRDAKVKKRTIWMHDDQVARVIARVGSQGMSEFIRQAVEAKLEGEAGEDPEPEPSSRSEPAVVVKPRSTGIESLFEDDD